MRNNTLTAIFLAYFLTALFIGWLWSTERVMQRVLDGAAWRDVRRAVEGR